MTTTSETKTTRLTEFTGMRQEKLKRKVFLPLTVGATSFTAPGESLCYVEVIDDSGAPILRAYGTSHDEAIDLADTLADSLDSYLHETDDVQYLHDGPY